MTECSAFKSLNQLLSPVESNSYTTCYCEENVWKLCEKVKLNNEAHLDKCYAVFISNPNQTVALRNQKAGHNNEGLVVWDYHVIFLIVCPDDGCFVFDLDSSLMFPSSFETYIEKTFYSSTSFSEQFISFFRMVNATDYLGMFSSDRRHMKEPNGTWISPPPTWPPIKALDCDFNLDEYTDMNSSKKGKVLSLAGFKSEVASLLNSEEQF
nr:PREDICTED: protein N-terminal glutamine amidohydrolase [Bemisia tabaci]